MLIPFQLWGESPSQPRLRILTINVWSGLDYEGVFKFGEYEPRERRALRFESLVTQVKKLDPDVVFIQEANFAGRYARRVARALGFHEIHQVLNGGIKVGPFGIPVNFKEGMAILARPALNLQTHDVWKLSGPFGIYGDFLTFHFNEAVFSLVGKITAEGLPLYLVNVHLVSSPPEDESVIKKFRELMEGRTDAEAQVKRALADTRARNLRRESEVLRLIEKLKSLPGNSPVVFAGDFNTTEDAPEIQIFLSASGAISAWSAAQEREPELRGENLYSWDPERNENIGYSTRNVNASGRVRSGYGLLNALEGTVRRRIDHIFLSRHFRPEDVLCATVAVDSSEAGLPASDHFGILAEVDLGYVQKTCPKESKAVERLSRFTKEFLPILMYDTDIGFGYGAKVFLLNPLRRSESFDLILFNSSRGERWYKLVFSWPDFETRQRKLYPLAVDVTLDYDKMIKNRFFGVGNRSAFEDREYYTREPFEVSVALSRGFTMKAVGQVGLRYKAVLNANFSPESRLHSLPPSLNAAKATYFSLFGSWRYDSRNSFIHPSEGLVLQGEAEYAPRTEGTNVSFSRVAGWIQ
jgi:endonuclease/exonuclease/phosphatase family metal-dependent hydrolase